MPPIGLVLLPVVLKESILGVKNGDVDEKSFSITIPEPLLSSHISQRGKIPSRVDVRQSHSGGGRLNILPWSRSYNDLTRTSGRVRHLLQLFFPSYLHHAIR